MSLPSLLLVSCCSYFANLAFFLIGAFWMFFASIYHKPCTTTQCYACNHGQTMHTSASVTTLANNSAEFYSQSKDSEDLTLSFLLLSGDISGCDINVSPTFDRLKAQSRRTIQALVNSRRASTRQTAAMRVKKARQRMTGIVWKARHCRM